MADTVLSGSANPVSAPKGWAPCNPIFNAYIRYTPFTRRVVRPEEKQTPTLPIYN